MIGSSDVSSNSDVAEAGPFKVIFVGDPAVGKTAVVQRLCGRAPSEAYQRTVGIEFYATDIYPPSGKGLAVALQVWDVDGDQLRRHRASPSLTSTSILRKCLSGTHVVCVVYDVTRHATFEHVHEWLDCVQNMLLQASASMPLFYLVGNKADVPPNMRAVSEQEHVRCARETQMAPFMLSARTGERVDKLRQSFVTDLTVHEGKPARAAASSVVTCATNAAPSLSEGRESDRARASAFQATEHCSAKTDRQDASEGCQLM